jgi:hypothetical protein
MLNYSKVCRYDRQKPLLWLKLIIDIGLDCLPAQPDRAQKGLPKLSNRAGLHNSLHLMDLGVACVSA